MPQRVRKMRRKSVRALLALSLAVASADNVGIASQQLSFDFGSGLEGWGAAAATAQSGAATLVAEGATGVVEVRAGQVGGSSQPAWLDSPTMRTVAHDATYVVLRMRHAGSATKGLLWLRKAAAASVAPADTSAQPGGVTTLPSLTWPAGGYLELAPFALVSDGRWHVYAVPVSPTRPAIPSASVLTLTQARLFPALTERPASAPTVPNGGASPLLPRFMPAQDALVTIDYVRIVHAPTIYRVGGCDRGHWPSGLNQYFATIDLAFSRGSASTNASLPFARTYNCAEGGGDVITVRGEHFGTDNGGHDVPLVTVDGLPCTNVTWIMNETAVQCITPPRRLARAAVPPALAWTESDTTADARDTVLVSLRHAQNPILSDAKPFLRFASPVRPVPAAPVVTNVGATCVTVQWMVPTDTWQAMTVTGYALQWRMALLDDVAVGNTGAGCNGSDGSNASAPVPASGEYRGADAAGDFGELALGVGKPADFAGASRKRAYVSEAEQWGLGPDAMPGLTRGLGSTSPVASSVLWGPWGVPSGGGEALTSNATYSLVIRGLEPGRRYQFRVLPLTEADPAAPGTGGADWTVDRYGERIAVVEAQPVSGIPRPPPPAMLRGYVSAASCDVRTLPFDVLFTGFDANSTLDHGPVYPASSVGPDGWAGGEGHYGLVILGSAHIANCNASHACCDGFGGEYFLDIVRFLDGWSGSELPVNASQYGACSDCSLGKQPRGNAPLYRFDAASGDYTPVGLDGRAAREGADALNTASAANSLDAADAYAEGRAEAVALNASAGDVASAAAPILRAARLRSSSDPILGRSLGRTPSTWFSPGAEGLTTGASEPGVWDGYDDTGWLLFLPASEVAKLDATRAASEDAGTAASEQGIFSNGTSSVDGKFVPAGAAWAGVGPLDDPRIDPNEGNWSALAYAGQDIGVLPGQYIDAPVPDNWAGTWRRQLEAVGVPTDEEGGRRRPEDAPFEPGPIALDAALGRPELPPRPVQVQTRDSTPTVRPKVAGRPAAREESAPRRLAEGVAPAAVAPPLPFTRPVLRTCGTGKGRQFVHRDRFGRRIVGLTSNPVSSCTAVCTGISAPRPPALNGAPQWGSDVWGNGVLGGPAGAGAGGAGAAGYTGMPGGPVSVQTDAPVSGRLSTALPGGAVSSPSPFPPANLISLQQMLDPATRLGAAWAANVTAPCGPALRLTASHPSSTGAAWYARPLSVSEGFDTVFAFRMASPSVHCRTMADTATRCVSRGGGGFAFVLQTDGPAAVGGGADSGLGYSGLKPAVAVEFDTWADAASFDPGENHVSVHTRGAGAPVSGNETASLGHAHGSARVPDLTRGVLIARVVYEPVLTAAHVAHSAFASSGHATSFLQFREWAGGGGAAEGATAPVWGSSGGTLGALTVFVGDEVVPVLIVPLDLAAALGTGGRAWVGFTAATGADVWQTHDVLAWHFTSARSA